MVLNDKQKEILLIAEELFSDKGIDGTSIRDISKAAGINVAMINYYFGSKNQMITALFEIRLQRMREKLAALNEKDDINPMEKMILFLNDLFDILLKNAGFHIIMIRQLSKGSIDPEIFENIFLLKRDIMKMITQLTEEGYEQGIFKAKPDADILVVITIGCMSYLVHNERLFSGYWNTENHEEYSLHVKQHIYPHLINSLKAILMYNEQK
ncbi:TetR/AcrR family transcriptional regulator [Myroides injenensis]|uniref:TetR/AcrR family transcriptional regulator n=1 Tax=Myroides injenensis TaxID=1183151 RepID=UPI000289CCE6|nr:TetR/AcrR family transcriptional regulator [Myroides injenensis]